VVVWWSEPWWYVVDVGREKEVVLVCSRSDSSVDVVEDLSPCKDGTLWLAVEIKVLSGHWVFWDIA
jgi:hypothetical protein